MTNPDLQGRASDELRFRRPVESDYPALALVVDDWWDGRVVQGLLPRLWLRHFGSTSWLAEEVGATGRPRSIGFLVGFRSPDVPGVGVLQAVGVDPNRRRRGIGRDLIERFTSDCRTAGLERIEALIWPGNRRGLDFLRAVGFRPEDGPGTRNLYGTAAFDGYDFGTEDRARLWRRVAGSGPGA
jgi:GNAT superfamily N-acetyltransferase